MIDVEYEKEGDIGIITAVGDITHSEGDAFSHQLFDIALKECKNIVIDLTEVGRVSSWGLGILSQAYLDAKENSGGILLAGISEQISKLLEVTQLDKKLQVYPDKDAALDSLNNS